MKVQTTAGTAKEILERVAFESEVSRQTDGWEVSGPGSGDESIFGVRSCSADSDIRAAVRVVKRANQQALPVIPSAATGTGRVNGPGLFPGKD